MGGFAWRRQLYTAEDEGKLPLGTVERFSSRSAALAAVKERTGTRPSQLLSLCLEGVQLMTWKLEVFVDANSCLYDIFDKIQRHVERAGAFRNASFGDVLRYAKAEYRLESQRQIQEWQSQADVLLSYDNRQYRPEIKLEEELRRLGSSARQQKRRQWYRRGRQPFRYTPLTFGQVWQTAEGVECVEAPCENDMMMQSWLATSNKAPSQHTVIMVEDCDAVAFTPASRVQWLVMTDTRKATTPARSTLLIDMSKLEGSQAMPFVGLLQKIVGVLLAGQDYSVGGLPGVALSSIFKYATRYAALTEGCIIDQPELNDVPILVGRLQALLDEHKARWQRAAARTGKRRLRMETLAQRLRQADLLPARFEAALTVIFKSYRIDYDLLKSITSSDRTQPAPDGYWPCITKDAIWNERRTRLKHRRNVVRTPAPPNTVVPFRPALEEDLRRPPQLQNRHHRVYEQAHTTVEEAIQASHVAITPVRNPLPPDGRTYIEKLNIAGKIFSVESINPFHILQDSQDMDVDPVAREQAPRPQRLRSTKQRIARIAGDAAHRNARWQARQVVSGESAEHVLDRGMRTRPLASALFSGPVDVGRMLEDADQRDAPVSFPKAASIAKGKTKERPAADQASSSKAGSSSLTTSMADSKGKRKADELETADEGDNAPPDASHGISPEAKQLYSPEFIFPKATIQIPFRQTWRAYRKAGARWRRDGLVLAERGTGDAQVGSGVQVHTPDEETDASQDGEPDSEPPVTAVLVETAIRVRRLERPTINHALENYVSAYLRDCLNGATDPIDGSGLNENLSTMILLLAAASRCESASTQKFKTRVAKASESMYADWQRSTLGATPETFQQRFVNDFNDKQRQALNGIRQGRKIDLRAFRAVSDTLEAHGPIVYTADVLNQWGLDIRSITSSIITSSKTRFVVTARAYARALLKVWRDQPLESALAQTLKDALVTVRSSPMAEAVFRILMNEGIPIAPEERAGDANISASGRTFLRTEIDGFVRTAFRRSSERSSGFFAACAVEQRAVIDQVLASAIDLINIALAEKNKLVMLKKKELKEKKVAAESKGKGKGKATDAPPPKKRRRVQTTLQNLVESAEAMQQDDQELEELEAAASPTRDGDEDDADDADDADDDTTRKSVGYYDLSQSERAGRVFVHLIMQAADDDDFFF